TGPSGESLATKLRLSDRSTGGRLLRVTTAPVASAGPTHISHSYTGVVAARRTSNLAAKSTGRVERILVELGSLVKKGQPLIELDHEQLDAQLGVAQANLAAAQARLQELTVGPRRQDIEQARARVAELEANLQLGQANFVRTRELRNSGSISQQEFDQTQFQLNATAAQLRSAEEFLGQLLEGTREEQLAMQRATVQGLEAQVRQVNADLADRSIVAPFDGQVQSRLVDEGVVVATGQQLLTVVEGAPFEIRVGLPSDVVVDLQGSQIDVSLGTSQLNAFLDRMGPTLSESTRTRQVILRLDESSSQQVSIGAAVLVTVMQPVASQGFWVPTRALTVGSRGLWAVYVAVPTSQSPQEYAPQVVERRQVELLRAHGEWSEIRGAISSSDKLIVAGVHRITPGQLVECIDETNVE
ncbi:MAG: efflux RND transporter periplasmic adaptor subunit, partial [Planctomycetales bacterium]|nr:efflux RND transporter periplasmic adaptor subunit [Planctomycetales bacterium]